MPDFDIDQWLDANDQAFSKTEAMPCYWGQPDDRGPQYDEDGNIHSEHRKDDSGDTMPPFLTRNAVRLYR